MHVLIQRCKDVYLCLIDYQKAFDRVRHHKMIGILNDLELNEKDLRIISNLYCNQKELIEAKGERSEAISIVHGVRQGCVLSPLLFNIYPEQIFREALEDGDKGTRLNGERINNILTIRRLCLIT